MLYPHVTWVTAQCCTGWPRPIGCLKLQVIFRKRATKYRSLLRKMTCKDEASYGSWPPCMSIFCGSRTLQHSATHCNTLQHTATHCNTLPPCSAAQEHCNTVQRTATHCNTLPPCMSIFCGSRTGTRYTSHAPIKTWLSLICCRV